MRPPAEYVALRDIRPPDSYAVSARQGDDVTEAVRANLNLVVGLDVMPKTPDAVARPADDAPRIDWQNYAVSRGVPYAEAVNLDTKDLTARAHDTEGESAAGTVMPDPGDRKAAWVEWATWQIVQGTAGRVDADTARDRANEGTKADLVAAFGPEPDEELRDRFLAEQGTAQPVDEPAG